jgi:adenylate kinase
MKGAGALARRLSDPYRANECERDMSLSGRERAEGFPAFAVAVAVTVAVAVAVTQQFPSERAEGCQF